MYYLDEIDGETRQPKPEFLEELAASANRIVVHAESEGIAVHAALARRIRHCVWEGQHWTERHWDTEKVSAYPFHGASDFRHRLADMLANQRVAEGWTAVARAQVQFQVEGPGGAEAAAWLGSAWRDIRDNELGLKWMIQNLLLLQYLHGGGRSVAGMRVGWRRETELRAKRVRTEDALAAWVAVKVKVEGAEAAAAAEAFGFALEEPLAGTADGLADALREAGLARNAREARWAAKDLRRTGMCELAMEEVAADGPELEALALGDRLWIPPETPVADLDSCGEFHLTQWMDRASVRATAARDGWDARFVEELIGDGDKGRKAGHAGEAAFPTWTLKETEDGSIACRDEAHAMRDYYQLVRSYFRGVGEDGVPARYEVLWTPLNKERTALGVRLCRAPHGQWPVQLYAGEVLGAAALDSRGLPGLAAGYQALGKQAHDTVANVGMLQVPPVVSKGAGSGDHIIEPLGNIRLGITGSIEFMKPPQVPYATLQFQQQLDHERDLYFGLPGEKVPAQLWQNAQALRVGLHLGQSANTVRRLMGVFTERLPRESLPAALQAMGPLPVQMKCNPREWDMEYLEKVGTVLNTILRPMDTQGRLNLGTALESMALAMMPDHADTIMLPPDAANQKELAEEQRNLTLIRAGIRPQVPLGGGADYAGRLAMYREMEEANATVFDDMVPKKRALLEEHRAVLEQQATQYGENREIGRRGARKEVGAVEAAGDGGY
jgi:hypothetical protein